LSYKFKREINTGKSRQDVRQTSVNEKRRFVKNKAGYEIKINQSKDVEQDSMNISHPSKPL